MDARSEQFLIDLYEEKLKHKGHRLQLLLQKLFFIVGLFGAGTIKIANVDLNNLLYFVPFVAMAYDMYIFAEDFKVKRVGLFVQLISNVTCEDERQWESWVGSHREPLAVFASLVLTVIALLASAAVVYLTIPDHTVLFIWLPLSLLAILSIFFYAWMTRSELRNAAKEAGTATRRPVAQIPDPLHPPSVHKDGRQRASSRSKI